MNFWNQTNSELSKEFVPPPSLLEFKYEDVQDENFENHFIATKDNELDLIRTDFSHISPADFGLKTPIAKNDFEVNQNTFIKRDDIKGFKSYLAETPEFLRSIEIVSPVSDSESESKLKNGKLVWELEDKNKIIGYPDGTVKSLLYPNINKVFLVNGDSIMFNESNNEKTYTFHKTGIKKTTYPSGTVKYSFPDGRFHTEYSDGTLESSKSDGTVIISSKNPIK
ncbi:hypothetical protein AYI68_g352 [Smittium mucronatum]|uniref:Centromere protein J n=1 Tax=Smittium mucronatum TaxID=133383 RepID=A0A1R0H8N1_9FUNG|nr:hypothetical protein AYI68_g352 [Smittium mucronatum]